MKIKEILIFLALFLMTVVTFASSTHPGNLTFPDGTHITIKDNQEVTVYQKNQMISQSWFGTNGFDYWQSVHFVQQLQKAVKNGNKQAIANMIQYPLTINGSPKRIIKNKAEFLKSYTHIFSLDVQKTITSLNPYVLFCNSEGVSFANGLMWITNSINNASDFKIWVINL